jgi:tRNA-2-methylthio-N6-dimethylallyladenosine synthase
VQTFRKYNAVKRINEELGFWAVWQAFERKFLEEEKIVDLVVGPDAYKDLPNLLAEVEEGRDAINVILSKDETYGDISPVRLMSNGITALVSITRGCDNMCTFCVVLLPVDASAVVKHHEEGNSGFMGQRQRNHFLDKM